MAGLTDRHVGSGAKALSQHRLSIAIILCYCARIMAARNGRECNEEGTTACTFPVLSGGTGGG